MAGDEIDPGEGYSSLVGLVYVFNLIVGTGALTMPAAFSHAGWLLSLIILLCLSFMSFLTTTFVIEAMAIANALVHWRTAQHLKRAINSEENMEILRDPCTPQMMEELIDDELISSGIVHSERVPLLLSNTVEAVDTPVLEYYNITERIELGKMASLFFNKIGVNMFYICIAIYLYGDLAIYGTAVSTSLRDITCVYVNETSNETAKSDDPCWGPDIPVSRFNAYRIYLTVFLLLLGPFTFFNVQKTKYLQMLTTFLRWFAFITMIILASRILIMGKGDGNPPLANFSAIPDLFGVCVYSFMCHHSLPSLVTPIHRKDRLVSLLAADYILILSFYALLAFVGIFAFGDVKNMFTLNFYESRDTSAVGIIGYFLALFPVFTLSTTFPIIAITLRNNLKALFLSDSKQYSVFVEKFLFPLVVVLPPIAVTMGTENLSTLVGITGSYAGAGIQYIVPALLVYYARKKSPNALGMGLKNQHTSPFKHVAWIGFVLVWAVACIILVTVDHFIS